MAQFGGNKNQPPWLGGGGNPHGHGRPDHMQPGLMGFGGPHGAPPNSHGGPPGQGMHQAGPPVFAAQPGHHPGIHGPPGLSLVHGPHTPATVAALAGQQGVTYRGAAIPPFAAGAGGAGSPAQQAQQILQQQAVAAVAAVGLQQHHQQQQHQAQTTSGTTGTNSGPTQRVFTGTVTKFHENFGFVDEDVFFQTSVVKGQTPRVNDRVLVEAGFNANMPFKWNATRIQVLPNQQQRNVGGSQGGPNTSSNNSGHGTNSDVSTSQGARSVNPSATPNAQAFSNTGSNTQAVGGPPPAPKIHSREGGYGNHSHRDQERGSGSTSARAGVGLGAPPRGGSTSNLQKSNNLTGDNSRNDRERRGGATRDDGSRGGGNSSQRGMPNYSGSGAGSRDRERDRGDRDRDRHSSSKDKDESSKRARSPITGSGLQSNLTGGIKRSRSPVKDKIDRDNRSRDKTSKSLDDNKDAAGGKSRSRSRSPPRRRQRRDERDDRDRPGGSRHRYSVSVPKIPLHFPGSNVMELKKRYSNMYIPSDFFTATHSWNRSFPIHQPLKLMQCKNLTGDVSGSVFHIFGRDSGVELPISDPDAIFDPSDADHIYSAKVMLMALPPPEELLQKSCQLGESSYHNRDSLIHPTRAMQFLVGVRGKNETMAIGGPWSPSLDGPNPDTDPSVLVRTAIRTCKALSGVDLSNCTKWHRFLEIHYRRQETTAKPQRTETTVVFLPDVWSVMPTSDDYSKTSKLYEEALQTKLMPAKKEGPAPKKDKNLARKDIDEETAVEIVSTSSNVGKNHVSDQTKKEDDNEANSQSQGKDKTQDVMDLPNEEFKTTTEEKDEKEGIIDEEEETASGKGDENSTEPTSWKLLDIKGMKVNELRIELDSRGLNSKGLKAQLITRLQEALDKEEEAETTKVDIEMDAEETPESASVQMETPQQPEQNVEEEANNKKVSLDDNKTEELEVMEVDRKPKNTEKTTTNDDDIFLKPAPAMDEKQKQALSIAYKLPETPCILVHPHPKAKSGKFDCTTMSLSVLLDYRTEDNKEGTFEVSLFAELFNEMMMRDSGYQIYRAICDPERAWRPLGLTKDQKEEKDVATDAEEGNAKDLVDGNKDLQEKCKEGALSVTALEGDEKAKAEHKKDKKIKMVTRDKNLLLACSYFDLNHSGYIETKDTEDILLALNLNLSRAQAKKVVSRVLYKDQLNYRHFTDRPEDEDPKAIEIKSSQEEEQLGQGFKAFLPTSLEKDSLGTPKATSAGSDGFCTHNGVVVDIGKLLSQLERSEQARFDAESRLSATNKILGNIREAEGKQAAIKEKLQNEAKDLKKKLRSIEDSVKSTETENHRYMSILKEVHSKISPLFVPPGQSTPGSSSVTVSTISKATEKSISDETSITNGKNSSVSE